MKKFTYSQTKGVANINESNRSKNPPWPGMIWPLSLTPAIRFSLDSRRSPKVPVTEAIIARIAHQLNDCPKTNHSSKEKARYPIIKDESIIPPMVPSQVFLGEILDNGVL